MASTRTPREIMSALIEGRKPQRRSKSVYLNQWNDDSSPFDWGYDAIFSYGPHFPMAVYLASDRILVNTGRYSMTTSIHQSGVRESLSEHGYAPTDETKTYRGHTYQVWTRA